MKKFANIPGHTGKNTDQVLAALVDAMAYITAQQQPRIEQLPATSTLADCVAKINEILARLQGTN